jgi:hypothetical protein
MDLDTLFAKNDVVLYDRSTDPGEVTNLAYSPAHRQIVAEYRAKLESLITAEIWRRYAGMGHRETTAPRLANLAR